MFIKCKACGYVTEKKTYKENNNICPSCQNYGWLNAKDRINSIIDENTFSETNNEWGFYDPISFPGYKEKYIQAREQSHLNEAIITGKGEIYSIPVLIGVMDPTFMMGSMGAAVGEKVVRLFEEGERDKKPVIIFSASGGARMQEGIIALMQMAKTSSAVASYRENKGLFISILTNPTTGGVSASFAFLGDIILAEPCALIGFAGKRVIADTISQTLPAHFQTAEYLLEHGFLDSIVHRKELKTKIHQLLRFHYYT